MTSFWPLFELELRTSRLLLRPIRDEDFEGLLKAIDAGIHDPDVMPFSVAWTDEEPEIRRRSAAQFWWRNRATWEPDDWQLPFTVLRDGTPIGVQSLSSKEFPVLREVESGSWLSLAHQGYGFGKEMRAAVLQLAFEGLGAEIARSAAFTHNAASAAVSKAIGYRENGRQRRAPRGEPQVMVHYELTRQEWQERRARLPPAQISGLEPALPMFALTRAADA